MTTFRNILITFFCLCAVGVAEEKSNQQSIKYPQSMEYWEAKIKTIDPNSRESQKFVPSLMKLLQDRNTSEGLRERIALTLGRMGKNATDAVPLVVRLLAQTKEGKIKARGERLWLLKSLSLYGQYAKSATLIAITIVKNERATVTERRAAMELLSRIGTADQRVLLVLTDSLTIRSTPKNGLSKADSALLRETATEAIAYLGIHGKSAIPALNRLLFDDDEGVRRKAVVALGAIGHAAEITLPGLLDLMASDSSAAVQDEVVDTLAKIGPVLLPSLKYLLNEKDAAFRRRIVKSICAMQTDAKPLLKELQQLLQDDDAEIRINCAETVWTINHQANLIIPVTLKLLQNKDRQIRIRAARLLIKLREDATPAIPTLKKMQHHSQGNVRHAATYVLRKLQRIDK